MTSYQQRDNVDGPMQAPHFFKIIMPESLEEGKLVSILNFMIFFRSENRMVINVVHLIFFICD